jgi:signal transduction histidine kinase
LWLKNCEDSRISHNTQNFEFFEDLDGTEKWFYVSLHNVRSPTPHNPRFAYVMTDITDKKCRDRENQLVRQKLEVMNIVAWHDVLNKITGLRGYVELTKDMVREQKAREFIECEDMILQRINDEIQFTVEYQEMGTRSLKWVNVNTAVKRAISAIEDDTISINIKTEDLEIYCDPIISRMFFHLINNTKKYCDDIPSIRIHYHDSPEGLVLVYEDNSQGIPENKKKEIFVRGVGKSNCYGLIFVHDILEISGIHIRESGISEGARFEMTVPVGRYRMGSR